MLHFRFRNIVDSPNIMSAMHFSQELAGNPNLVPRPPAQTLSRSQPRGRPGYEVRKPNMSSCLKGPVKTVCITCLLVFAAGGHHGESHAAPGAQNINMRALLAPLALLHFGNWTTVRQKPVHCSQRRCSLGWLLEFMITNPNFSKKKCKFDAEILVGMAHFGN